MCAAAAAAPESSAFPLARHYKELQRALAWTVGLSCDRSTVQHVLQQNLHFGHAGVAAAHPAWALLSRPAGWDMLGHIACNRVEELQTSLVFAAARTALC